KDRLTLFQEKWGNSPFRQTRLTYLSLIFLLLIYPATSGLFTVDSSTMFESLNQGVLLAMLISTIVVQWGVFLLIYVTAYREQTGLTGLGFKRIRRIDFAWAAAFLLASNVLLAGLAWLLGQIGLPMPGEISFLIPTDLTGKVVWIAVSATAGICEETAFRGYLMTRLRLVGKFSNWIVPTAISAVAFGACHSYQGLPGFIVITVYGVLFSLLYIRTGTIWPGIIAHFFQDFSALFIPQP
ncbi:MAG: CPBP family intramembrane glutamic endopeptidase, partial [Candidatus Zixiibacteriota bacterium]